MHKTLYRLYAKKATVIDQRSHIQTALTRGQDRQPRMENPFLGLKESPSGKSHFGGRILLGRLFGRDGRRSVSNSLSDRLCHARTTYQYPSDL